MADGNHELNAQLQVLEQELQVRVGSREFPMTSYDRASWRRHIHTQAQERKLEKMLT